MLKSIEGNFDNPIVNTLLIKHFIELKSVSPKGSTHVLDIGGLKDPSIKFWSLWEDIFIIFIFFHFIIFSLILKNNMSISLIVSIIFLKLTDEPAPKVLG